MAQIRHLEYRGKDFQPIVGEEFCKKKKIGSHQLFLTKNGRQMFLRETFLFFNNILLLKSFVGQYHKIGFIRISDLLSLFLVVLRVSISEFYFTRTLSRLIVFIGRWNTLRFFVSDTIFLSHLIYDPRIIKYRETNTQFLRWLYRILHGSTSNTYKPMWLSRYKDLHIQISVS